MLKHEAAVDRVFHALSDSNRRAMVERLSQGPASVSDLATPLGISLAAVVQHIQVLEQAGVIKSEKLGRVRSCQLLPAGLNPVDQWIRERKSLWERRFDRLAEVLGEGDEELPQGKKYKKGK